MFMAPTYAPYVRVNARLSGIAPSMDGRSAVSRQ